MVCDFAQTSVDVAQNRVGLQIELDVLGQTWDSYWAKMRDRNTWAAGPVLICTSVMLGINISMVETAMSTRAAPFRTLTGVFEAPGAVLPSMTIFLGLDHDNHFQSLIRNGPQEMVAPRAVPTAAPSAVESNAPNGQMAETGPCGDRGMPKEVPKAVAAPRALPTKCPACHGDYPQLMRHLRKKACADMIGPERLAELRELFKRQAESQKAAKYNQSDKAAARKATYQKTDKGSATQAKYEQTDKAAARQAKYEQTEKRAKRNHSEDGIHRNTKSLQKAREMDYVGTKAAQTAKKATQRAKKLKAKEDRCAELVKTARRKKMETEEDRRLEFQKATLLGPDFACLCCHKKHFRENVTLYTDKVKADLEDKGMTEEVWMANPRVFTKIKVQGTGSKVPESFKMAPEYEQDRYICKTCLDSYLRKKKIPSYCVMNNLQLHDTDEELMAQDLVLTELEGALVAKTILFEKILLLRKSLWTGLKDQIVNVPIPDDSLNELMTELPRVPSQAGMVVAVLKRRLNFENHHKKELINPNRMVRLVVKMIKAGNPHYTNVDTPEGYKERCAATDQTGYQLIYGEVDDEVVETLETLPEGSVLTDEMDVEQGDPSGGPELRELVCEDDDVVREEHPLRRFQVDYDSSIALTDKFPEISVAPGEGQTPKGMLGDKDIDIKGFPQLHNPDGSNGLSQERLIKLSAQDYFVQRILNVALRFCRCAAYLYFAVAYLEQQRIHSNICRVGTRGKKTVNSEGGVSYELEDAYLALEGIPNTPRYWLTGRYELLSKLDCFGVFQVFWTLSCADLRWDANFASILLQRGYSINVEVVVRDGQPDYEYQARKRDGEWKPLRQFIEEDVEVSFHELIRGNVLTATRYFQHRVQHFIRKIMMAESAPMPVKMYSYKTEFQARGAGHIHGVIWLDTHRLSKMVRAPDGNLVDGTNETLFSDQPLERPLQEIDATFKRIRRTQPLTSTDLKVLATLIDEFSTCSTHAPIVGVEVATIAKAVNTHRHTATCTKRGGTECRFRYPREPAPYTIVQQPLPADMAAEDRRKTLLRYQEILAAVKSFCNDEAQVKVVLAAHNKQEETTLELHQKGLEARIRLMCQMLDIEYREYLNALKFCHIGYNTVLRRDLDEVYVNPYNREYLRAWNGNMDVQFVLDPFKVSTYVVDYVSKDDTAVAKKMREAIKDDRNLDLRQKMRKGANTYVQFRQIGEAEAAYRLVPRLKLRDSNVTCEFVSTGLKEERAARFRKATQQQIESGVPCVELVGHEGLYYEVADLWSKYLRRPDILKELCFAQFGRMYKSYSSKRAEEEEAEPKDTEDQPEAVAEPQEVVEDDDEDEESKFHYVMTYRDNGKRGQPLPKIIELKDPKAGELRRMVKRTRPIAIRFNKVKQRNEPERYMAKELMLYCPLQTELEQDQVQRLYLEEFGDKLKVAIVKAQVMPHIECIEEARHYVAETVKELDLELAGLDAEGLKDNLEIIEENEEHGEEAHPDYEHCMPGDDEFIQATGQDRQTACVFRAAEMPSPEDLRKKLRALDPFQRQVLDITVTYFKDIVKARKDGNKLPEAPLLMVHGGAGAGKSTVINAIYLLAELILRQPGDNPDMPVCLKMAHTGCAAVNIDGYTLCSALSMGFACKLEAMTDKNRDMKRALYQNLKIVIIDEISMVSKAQNELLSFRLGEITNKRHLPYGGMAVIFFGDLCQLRPVYGKFIFTEGRCRDDETGASELAPLWDLFSTLTLEINHRQGEDKPYADMLNKIRREEQTEEDLLPLLDRVRDLDHPDLEQADLWIAPIKVFCQRRNKECIERLSGEAVVIKASHANPIQKNFRPPLHPADGTVHKTGYADQLTLKVGARVMIIDNINVADGLCNGQLGILVAFVYTKGGRVDKLAIRLKDLAAGEANRSKFKQLAQQYPNCVFVERANRDYQLNQKSGEVGSKASVIQFPIAVAFCMTCHKVQGQSIGKPTKVAMELSSVFGGGGMAYVMLSRIQCIDQLYIISPFDPKKIYADKGALEAMQKLEAKSMNKNPTPWKDTSLMHALRIAAFNCAGLSAHHQDLLTDHNLLRADVIHLSETSLTNESSQFDLPGYKVKHCIVSRGKGVSTYYRQEVADSQVQVEMITGPSFQICRMQLKKMDSISVYRSSGGSIPETLESIRALIQAERPTLISGDFNLCYRTSATNNITTGLISDGFEQLVTEATQIQGGVIDHLYWRDSDESQYQRPTVERSSSYYSDHDTLMVTLVPK